MSLTVTLDADGVLMGTVTIDPGQTMFFGGVDGATLDYRYRADLYDGQHYEGSIRYAANDGFYMLAAVIAEIAKEQEVASR